MTHPNHRAATAAGVVPNTAPAETARAKRLQLEEQDERTRGRIALQMRAETGLSQAAYAEVIGTSRDIVKQHEAGAKSPNLRHLLDAPDEAIDVFLRELLAERRRRGFAARMVIASPELVHDCEQARTSALVIELSDVMRARASGAEPHVQLKETGEAIESLTELAASLEERCR